MSEAILTLLPCPKCGHRAPVLTQTFETYCDGDKKRCIRWAAGLSEYTRKVFCDCRTTKYSQWWSRTIIKVNKRCKKCNGTGELKPEVVPAVPDKLRVTCPACLYTREEKPLDAQAARVSGGDA